MKKYFLVFCFSITLLLGNCFYVNAQMVLNVAGIKGDSRVASHADWMDINSMQMGVSRNAVEGTKGGTMDINIGVGKISELSFTKGFDNGSLALLAMSINGNFAGSATLHVLKNTGGSSNVYLEIILDRPFVSDYKISGDAGNQEESVSLRFNKIKFRYLDSRGTEINSFGWDMVMNRKW